MSIAIIALLIGILVPALGRAKSRAQQAVCASNLHGLATATANYLHDNQDIYFPYFVDIAGGRNWWFGFEAHGPGTGANRPLDESQCFLAPYLTTVTSQIQCPAFPYNTAGYFPKFAVHGASLGYNIAQGNQMFGQTGHADSVFVFADGIFFDTNPVFGEGFYIRYTPNTAAMSGYAHFRHSGKAQLVMADGHVETQTSSGGNHMTVAGGTSGNLAAPDGSNVIYGP